MNDFSILDPNAPIFGVLHSSTLFKKLKEDSELYIEIRKDNYINVYYQGGCVAKIGYNNKGLIFTTNAKYLGLKEAGYLKSEKYLEADLTSIKRGIEKEYSQTKYLKTLNTEDLSEKFYQADLVLCKYATIHIDAEFAYSKDDRQRIDIVCCDEDGIVSFYELKIIGDNRLSGDYPEVLYQINKYIAFINQYNGDLLSHYQRVYDAKRLLGLPIPPCRPKSINNEPILIVLNNYIKSHSARTKRINKFNALCQRKDFKLIWLNSNGDEITI